jgi:purine catabolism regulator
MLTVDGLASELGLELAPGTPGDRQIRWVHSTELPDPTPWLSGGELILSTGLQLETAPAQRAFVRRLAAHGCAGLGFGTGFGHSTLPRPLVSEAQKQELPLFEVPYSMPFIAITEKAFSELVSAEYAVLRRGAEIHQRLERLVLEERGLGELVAAVSAVVGWPVGVMDAGGRTLAEAGRLPKNGDAQIRLPVFTRGGLSEPHAWVVAAPQGEAGDFERLILQQAATVVALELMRQRAMRDTERRLAGDMLAEALTGRLGADDLARRLGPFGITSRAAVTIFRVEDPEGALAALDGAASAAGLGALVAVRDGFACAVISGGDPFEFAAKARAELPGEHVRAAASRMAPLEAIHRSYQEARCALEATGMANGRAPEVASYRDLGAFSLLLSLQDDEALRLFCDSVLGPLENGGGDYGEELVRSLEAFIEHNGQWESAARALFCHRHTLRYRVRKIEDLTGRDLGRAQDRIEFWLALRAREMAR